MKTHDNHIILHLSGLADGGHDFSFHVPEGALELPDSFRAPVDVDVEVVRMRSQYLVTARAATSSVHTCDRCLEPVRLQHATSLTLVYSYGSGGIDAQVDEDDIRRLDPGDPTIDITADVREALILCLPMRITCGEDDAGNPVCSNPHLEQHLAGEPEPDPRWAVLQEKIQRSE